MLQTWCAQVQRLRAVALTALMMQSECSVCSEDQNVLLIRRTCRQFGPYV